MAIDYKSDIPVEPTGPALDRPLHDEDEDIEDDGYEEIP